MWSYYIYQHNLITFGEHDIQCWFILNSYWVQWLSSTRTWCQRASFRRYIDQNPNPNPIPVPTSLLICKVQGGVGPTFLFLCIMGQHERGNVSLLINIVCSFPSWAYEDQWLFSISWGMFHYFTYLENKRIQCPEEIPKLSIIILIQHKGHA